MGPGQRRVVGYTAAQRARRGRGFGDWRAPAQHRVEGYPPKARGAKRARLGSRSRVCRCVRACARRSSARISGRCDSLAQAGACFHMGMTPRPAAGDAFLGCHMHALGLGGQFGAPCLHGAGVLSTRCSARAGRPWPHSRLLFLSHTHVLCVPELMGVMALTGPGGFWCNPDGLAVIPTNTQL